DYQGNEVETEEVKQELKYVGVNSVPLEIDESKIKDSEEDNLAEKRVNNTVTHLLDSSATVLSLTEADAAVKKALIKYDYTNNDVHEEYEKLIDKYAKKGVKFDFSVPKSTKVGKDKNDFTYVMESELTKDGKT